MGSRSRCALIVLLLGASAVALAGCKTHNEAVADPCPNASSKGAPPEPKVGLTPDEQKAQDECSSATEAKDSVCADVDALKESVSDLKDVDVVKNGTNGLRDALTKVKDNADALRTDAESALRPAVDELDASLTALRTSIESVVSQGTSAVRTAAHNARQSAQDLESQARALYHCS